MLKRVTNFIFFLFLFTSCYKDHLYVQQEWVDANFLASTHVGTPDPRQECPPQGERILIAWKFPKNLSKQNLRLVLTVRFWDLSEEEITLPITSSRKYEAFNFFSKRILTYRIQVFSEWDELIETWEHHFWTKLIDVDKSSSSVSSHPMQESVIETP